MLKQAEGVGKTYDEALKNALEKIGLEKNKVNIELIEAPKRRIFSILESKEVKVRVTEIEKNENKTTQKTYQEDSFTAEEIESSSKKAESFINEFFEKLGVSLEYKINYEDNMLKIDIYGERAGLIIGYRGETLDALQSIVTSVINKNKEKHMRVLVDAENYRKKRIKTLEEVALKMANVVVSKRKSVTLEPMIAFERRVIHTTLQNHSKVKSSSVGDEPYRKVVISLK